MSLVRKFGEELTREGSDVFPLAGLAFFYRQTSAAAISHRPAIAFRRRRFPHDFERGKQPIELL
jgi:hypothetical protein